MHSDEFWALLCWCGLFTCVLKPRSFFCNAIMAGTKKFETSLHRNASEEARQIKSKGRGILCCAQYGRSLKHKACGCLDGKAVVLLGSAHSRGYLASDKFTNKTGSVAKLFGCLRFAKGMTDFMVIDTRKKGGNLDDVYAKVGAMPGSTEWKRLKWKKLKDGDILVYSKLQDVLPLFVPRKRKRGMEADETRQVYMRSDIAGFIALDMPMFLAPDLQAESSDEEHKKPVGYIKAKPGSDLYKARAKNYIQRILKRACARKARSGVSVQSITMAESSTDDECQSSDTDFSSDTSDA